MKDNLLRLTNVAEDLAYQFDLSYEGIHTVTRDDGSKFRAAQVSGDFVFDMLEDIENSVTDEMSVLPGDEIYELDGDRHFDDSCVFIAVRDDIIDANDRMEESAHRHGRRMSERVFTDRDFDNRSQAKAKPGEIWAAVQNLQDMFESAKKDGSKRMKENLVSFNGRRISSFNDTKLSNVSDSDLMAEYNKRFGK